MSSPQVPVTKKACDGCKIRKIRCGGGHPCRPCMNAHIQCTYIRVHQSRGPQKLRATTRHLIEQNQRNNAAHRHQLDVSVAGPERLATNAIASLLYIYHVRMYPVWPVIHVDSLVASLQRDSEGTDHETRALATAVAAATMAQLRLGKNCVSNRSITADVFASECLQARQSPEYRSIVNLNTVRTAFFLHVFYENQQPGGSESTLYLREAISLAQMMFLHREASYTELSYDEQQIRRRVLWLLFITERGVCILHKLPVVLKTDTAMPDVDAHDEPQVLPAFLKLLALFRLFEQAKMFDIIEDTHLGYSEALRSARVTESTVYDILQDKFRDGSSALDQICDVQRADLCVTRHWMRILTWKALFGQSLRGSPSLQWSVSPAFPLLVARDLVNAVSRLPRTALQAHGFGMQLKLYEIANSLADAVTSISMLPEAPAWDQDIRPSSVLARFHSILTVFRDGGNGALVEILYQKMAHAQSLSSAAVPRPLRGLDSAQKRKAEHQTIASSSNNDWEPWDATTSQASTEANVPVAVPQEYSSHTARKNEDSLDENQTGSRRDCMLSETLEAPVLPQRDFEGLWTYSQPPYIPTDYTALEQLSPSTELTTPLLDQFSADMVLNNLIFDAGDQLSLASYWSDDNTQGMNGLTQHS
ncbi:fungal-specific transcription factor domain-containing protein [Aspergillus granulosus]|uniref:Fungal-specific transcription factor domain-containing protein n=1 Tax=Aspergillus granulosus TaxID=176169 RepID=A0ABR4GS97_9EURO